MGSLVLRPGTESASPNLQGGFLTTGPPGRPLKLAFLIPVYSDACEKKRMHGHPGLLLTWQEDLGSIALPTCTFSGTQLIIQASPGLLWPLELICMKVLVQSLAYSRNLINGGCYVNSEQHTRIIQGFNTSKLTASSQQFCEMTVNDDTWQMRKWNAVSCPKSKPNKLWSSNVVSDLSDSKPSVLPNTLRSSWEIIWKLKKKVKKNSNCCHD